jgi:hypothetical protein
MLLLRVAVAREAVRAGSVQMAVGVPEATVAALWASHRAVALQPNRL